MDSTGARLKDARVAAGFGSARSAAQKFGWGTSTYAAHENGQNGLPSRSAATYAKAFKTTAAWLLTGEGPAPKRKGVVSSFDPDAPEDAVDPDAAPDASTFPADAIKELASKAGLGAGQTIATTYVRDGKEIVQRDAIADDYWRLPPDFVRSILGARPIDLLVLKGQGDSMEPTIMAGEPVIVNTAHKLPSPDGLYAIRDQVGEVVIKRLELFGVDPPRIRIISDNTKHHPQERGIDEIEIVGKVAIGLKLF